MPKVMETTKRKPNAMPTVHILLATYQGGEHLAQQLDAIAAQEHKDWILHISDDGSTDATLSCIQHFQSGQPNRVRLLSGPKKGATQNFFHLINHMDEEEGNLYAFCDQDDVWLPQKLTRAIEYLDQCNKTNGSPCLYFGAAIITDVNLIATGRSTPPTHAPSFRNALAQNIASGNTMVFNTSCLKLLKAVSNSEPIWHDWSAYQVTTACGGTIIYDDTPQIFYRQHEFNVVGAKRGWASRLKGFIPNLLGRYRSWGDATERSLSIIAPQMTAENRAVFNLYRESRHALGGLTRLRALRQAGVIRQTKSGQIALLIAAFLGLI